MHGKKESTAEREEGRAREQAGGTAACTRIVLRKTFPNLRIVKQEQGRKVVE